MQASGTEHLRQTQISSVIIPGIGVSLMCSEPQEDLCGYNKLRDDTRSRK